MAAGDPDFERQHPRRPPPETGPPGSFRRKDLPAADGRRRRRPSPVGPPARPAPDRDSLETVRTRLRSATVDQLADAFSAISRQPAGEARDLALAELDAELARREGVDELQVHDDPHSRQLDQLLDAGWSYLEAYAEVHHLDPGQLDRQAAQQLVDVARRPGERRRDTVRRLYAEQVYLQWLQAEDDTRGHLLSPAGKAKGIDPVTLWSGPAARARKYASPELKEWWESHGGRRTMTEFATQYGGDRRAAQSARLAGSGKDYGV